MKTTVAPASSFHDPGAFKVSPGNGRDTIAPPPESPHQNADLRLIIEEDQSSGSFIYKTLDRRTGEVVKQLPREEVVRLKDAPEYEPGDVIVSTS
jgi:flagellar protein FlaG